jgi:hypothetical protein
MDVTKADKTYNRRATAIRDERILCSREHSKLCFGPPEILRAAQNQLAPALQPEAVSSKVGNPGESQITNC